MEIPRYIVEMLFLRESVILPGFGELKTSVKNPETLPTGTLTPPGRTVSFNPSVKANDYVLARHIAEKENIPISQGNENLRTFVVEMMQALENHGVFTLSGIGNFSLDSRNSLSFTPDRDANFDLSTYGLGSVTPVEQLLKPRSATPEPVIRDKPDDTQDTPEPLAEETPVDRQHKKRWIWISIVVILMGGAGIIGYLHPDYFTSAWSHITEKLNLSHDASVTDTLPGNDQIPEENTQDVVNQTDTTEVIPGDAIPPAQIEPPPAQPPASGDFLIVAGCFGQEGNATKMVTQLRDKGYAGASVEGKTSSGLYRVSAGSFSSREEAQKTLKEANARNELKNAWVGKK